MNDSHKNQLATSPLEVAGIDVSPLHYIDGRRVASADSFELFSPIDQRPLGRIAEGVEAKCLSAFVDERSGVCHDLRIEIPQLFSRGTALCGRSLRASWSSLRATPVNENHTNCCRNQQQDDDVETSHPHDG